MDQDLPLSRFLLDLYRLAQESPAGLFREAALELLRGPLPFRAGWWGMAVNRRHAPFVATAALLDLPPAFVDEYNEIIELDDLAHQQVAAPGITVAWHGVGPNDSAAIEEFSLRYGLDSGLATSQLDQGSGGVLFVALYRQAGDAPFSEAERALMQAAMPHLVQAWSHNLRLAFLAESQAGAFSSALVDADGRLLDAGAAFVDAVQHAFPQWSGKFLPQPLQGLAAAPAPAIWRGAGKEIWRVSQPGALPLRLQCGRRASGGLTPREAAVAAAFAGGQSYKEIAATLGLAPATVRSYLQECYAKLQVKNKVELSRSLGGVR